MNTQRLESDHFGGNGRLAAEGEPKARIAERLEISGTTVIKAVSSDAPPRYERTAASTSFTPFEVRVRELLRHHVDRQAMQAGGADPHP